MKRGKTKFTAVYEPKEKRLNIYKEGKFFLGYSGSLAELRFYKLRQRFGKGGNKQGSDK